MVRKIDLLLLTLAAFTGVGLFHTSYRVQGLREEKAALDRQITLENDGIQVLRAEWSFLDDPSRLEQLASGHLTLKPITATQISGFDALPMRPAGQVIPVGAPAVAARKDAPVKAAAATVQGGRPNPSLVATLASVQAPPVPHLRHASKPGHPVGGPSLGVTHVSARSAPAYLPAKDDIGSLLTRLGRIQ